MMKKNDMHFDWKKITEDAFAPDAEIHSFSSEYERRKYGIMNGINNNGGERKRIVVKEKSSPKHTIAAIVSLAAAAVIVPTGIAVMNKNISKSSPAAQVAEEVTTEPAEVMSDSAKPAMTLMFSYIPGRYILEQGSFYCHIDTNESLVAALSPGKVFYSDDTESVKQQLIESFGGSVIKTEDYSFESHIDGTVSNINCTIIETSTDKAGTGCHKIAFVSLDDTGYFAEISITDPELSDDELQRILAGVSFVETDGTVEKVSPTDNINERQGEARQAKELVFGWVPERFSLNTTNAYGKYTNEDCTRGITPGGSGWYTGDFTDIINNEVAHPCGFGHGYRLVYDIQSEDASTAWERIACIGPYEEDVKYTSGSYFNSYVVKFRDSDYVGFFFASDDVTQDEIKQICGELSLTDTDGSITEWQEWYPETDEGSGLEDSVSDEYKNKLDAAQIYDVGDTFEVETGDGAKAAYTVNNVTIQDNFDGLTTDGIGNYADFSDYLDDDGTVAMDIISYTDEEGNPCEMMSGVRVVVVDMTVDMLSSDGTHEICICPDICGSYFGNVSNWTIDVSVIPSGAFCETLLDLRTDNLPFSFYSEAQSSKNNIEIGPDGSANVRVAFIATNSMDELFMGVGTKAAVHLGNVND